MISVFSAAFATGCATQLCSRGEFRKGKKRKGEAGSCGRCGLAGAAPRLLLHRLGQGAEGGGAGAAAGGGRRGKFACARRARRVPRRSSDSGRRARGGQGAVVKNVIPPCCSGTLIRARSRPAAAGLCFLGEMKLLRRTLGRCRHRRGPLGAAGRCGPGTPLPAVRAGLSISLTNSP